MGGLAAISARGCQPFLCVGDQPFDKGKRQIGSVACERHAVVAVAVKYLSKGHFRVILDLQIHAVTLNIAADRDPVALS